MSEIQAGAGAVSLIPDAQGAVDELRTLRDLIRWGASQFNKHELFFGHGTDNAIDEALFLALNALHLEPGLPEPLFDSRLTRTERERVVQLFCERVSSRTPAAYLLGEAWFAGLRFNVDPRVLIPRSPLAEYIERGFEPFVEPGAVERVLEIGTGSACIAIACAYAFDSAEVEAVDISEAALEVARQNIADHQLDDRVTAFRSDLFERCQGRYDLILSNPPYVPTASYRNLPAEYRHEPELALVAGDDGLDVVRQILRHGADFLTERGVLVVEVGEARAALESEFPELPVTWLDFERGGDDVFALYKDELASWQDRAIAN